MDIYLTFLHRIYKDEEHIYIRFYHRPPIGVDRHRLHEPVITSNTTPCSEPRLDATSRKELWRRMDHITCEYRLLHSHEAVSCAKNWIRTASHYSQPRSQSGDVLTVNEDDEPFVSVRHSDGCTPCTLCIGWWCSTCRNILEVKGSKCNSAWETGHRARYFIEPKAVTTEQKQPGTKMPPLIGDCHFHQRFAPNGLSRWRSTSARGPFWIPIAYKGLRLACTGRTRRYTMLKD
jgi:hypothetical protein